MFPFVSHLALQNISRAGIQDLSVSLPPLVSSATQAKQRTRQEGYANDHAENGFITVPANRCSGAVFRYEDVRKIVYFHLGKICCATSQRLKKVWNWRCLYEGFVSELVMPSERCRPPFCEISLKLEFSQGERFDVSDEICFFVRCNDVF